MSLRLRSFAVLAITGLLFAPSLGADFVWDDHRQILQPASMGQLTAIPDYFTQSLQAGVGDQRPAAEEVDLYRPVFLSLLSIQRYVAGEANPLPFHLTSLALHLLVCSLLLTAMRRWVGPGLEGEAALLFFALHPVSAEAVLFVSAQSDLTMAAGLLAAALLLDRKGSGKGIPATAWAAAACLGLALLSKESTLLVAPLLGWFLLRARGIHWRALLPCLGVMGACLGLRVLALGGLRSGRGADLDAVLHNAPILLADGLRGMATMQPTGLRHLSWEYADLGWAWTVSTGLLVLLLGLGTWRLRFSVPLAPWAWALLVLVLSPVSVVTTIDGWGGFGRYLYLVLALGVLALAQGYGALKAQLPPGPLLRLLPLLFLPLLLEGAVLQLAQKDWHDDEALGRSAVRNDPDRGVGYTWVAQALQREGGCNDAIPWYQRSVETDPDYHPGAQNLAICLALSDRAAEALAVVEELEARHGVGPKSTFARALALAGLQRFDEALDRARWGLSRAPRDQDLQFLVDRLEKQHTSRKTPPPTTEDKPEQIPENPSHGD